jgi:flagellar hook-basal body complex protein FliE
MSFSFSATAANKAHAKAIVVENGQQMTPEFARVLHAAIDGIRSDQPITIKASGHLATGQDYEGTTIKVEIAPVSIPAPPPARNVMAEQGEERRR